MSLSAVRAALADALAPSFPEARTVKVHGGTFAERDIPMLLADAPCLLVACLGLNGYQIVGRKRWSAALRWAVYCLGADGPATDRDVLAMDLANRLIDLLPGNLWGLAVGECQPPELAGLTADNLFSGRVNNLGVAFWAVAWSQRFTFTSEF